MENPDENSPRVNALSPAISEVNRSDRKVGRLRFFLLVLNSVEMIAVFVPRISSQWRSELGYRAGVTNEQR